jgi:hypothetical protein
MVRNSPTEKFIEAILADRPPEGFTANRSDTEILRVAIALRAARPDADGPDDRFVDDLRRQLAACRPEEAAAPDATRPRRQERRSLIPTGSPSRRGRAVPRRYAMVGKAAAAVFLVGATIGTTTALESGSSAPVARTATAPAAVRSGELVSAAGRALGRMYAYSGQSSWLFMNVHAQDLTGVYTCEVRLVSGATVRVGTVTLTNGSGVFAHIVDIDTGQVRAGMLVSPNGSTLATAHFS